MNLRESYRLTVSMPCFGRPERTKRSIDCIMSQDTNGWEAFIMGDCCPHFQKLIDSGYLEDMASEALRNNNKIHYLNWKKNYGGCGYHQTNYAIRRAKGKYLVFFANDDIITRDHFSHYLEIEGTDYDYMYFNSYLDPINQVRVSKLAPSEIGHSEIILKTSLARKLRPHSKKYGHDWDFINSMVVHSNGNGVKSQSEKTTYKVMHIPNFGTKDAID